MFFPSFSFFSVTATTTEHERQRIAGETGRRSSSGSGVTSPELGRDDSYGGMMEDDDFERARKNRKVSFTGDDNDGLPDDYGIDDFGNEEDYKLSFRTFYVFEARTSEIGKLIVQSVV